MSTINITTWNVDWFRNGKRSGKEWEYIVTDCDINIYNNIVEKTKEFLNEINAIVFMQEVPYKIKQGRNWVECDYHKKLHEDFPSDEYEIAENLSDYITRCTIAIFKKDTFSKSKDYYPCNNRTIGLETENITLLGVHMPTGFIKDDPDDEMWKKLIEYSSINKKIIIVGDFNAYIGCNKKITEERYKELCRVAKDIISDDTPTFIGLTPIDHIFLNFDTNQNYHVKIEQDWEFSDHKHIQVGLNY